MRNRKSIEVTKKATNQPVTLYPEHIVAIEKLVDADGVEQGAMVFVIPGFAFEVVESRVQVEQKVDFSYRDR